MLELAAVLLASLAAGAVAWLVRGRRPPAGPPASGVVVAAAAGAWYAAEAYRATGVLGAALGFVVAFLVAAGGFSLGTGALTRAGAAE